MAVADFLDLRVKKTFDDLPCSHRSWAHSGNCQYLHGYARSFTIEFGASSLQKRTGFVIDFSDLKDVRALLAGQFDHTVLVASDDPELETFRKLADGGLIQLRVMEQTGMEGSAIWVFNQVNKLITLRTANRVAVLSVEARESQKNAVLYEPHRFS